MIDGTCCTYCGLPRATDTLDGLAICESCKREMESERSE